MMPGTDENWVEGMEGNGGTLPKRSEQTDFLTYVGDSLPAFPTQHTQPAGIILR